jgi:hypothetical protein
VTMPIDRSGGYDGGKYEKQHQPADHDNLLNTAGIDFVCDLTLPLFGRHLTVRVANDVLAVL